MSNNFLDNLTSHWSFEETTGSTFSDDVGSNPLTISGVTLNQTGIIGKCGNYDGVNDNSKIAHASQVGLNIGTGSFTVNTWVKCDVLANATGFIVAKTLNTGGAGYTLLSGEKKFEMDISDGVTAKSVISALGFDNNAFHMLTGVVDRAAQLLHLYVDAVSQGSIGISAVGSLSNTQAFSVGSASNDAGFWANATGGGRIDQTIFWNGRAFSASDVTTLYNSGNGVPYLDFESGEPIPIVLSGVTPSIPSDSIKHILNSGRFQGSIVLDTTGQIGKTRLTNVASLRDTFLTMFKATSKNDIHLNTSGGNKLKAVASLDPNIATAADIINAVKDS